MFCLSLSLFGGTISSTKINELLAVTKENYLATNKSVEVVKPVKKEIKKSDFKVKEFTQGKYEPTKDFKKRKVQETQKAQNNYLQAVKNVDAKFEKELLIYQSKLLKEKKRQIEVKKELPKILQSTLKDALNLYLGKPKIESFDRYNPDDEVYITKIISKNFAIPVEIVVPLKEAQQLDKTGKLKSLKVEVTFEYSDENLYISKIIAKYKNRVYQTNIGDLSHYDKSFKLNESIKDTVIVWSSRKINNKDLDNYFKKQVELKKSQLAKKKSALLLKETFKKQRRNISSKSGRCEVSGQLAPAWVCSENIKDTADVILALGIANKSSKSMSSRRKIALAQGRENLANKARMKNWNKEEITQALQLSKAKKVWIDKNNNMYILVSMKIVK